MLFHGDLLSSCGFGCGATELCSARSLTANGGPRHPSVPNSSTTTTSSHAGHRPPGPSRRQNTLHSEHRRSRRRSPHSGHSYTTLTTPTATTLLLARRPTPSHHPGSVTQEQRCAPSSHQEHEHGRRECGPVAQATRPVVIDAQRPSGPVFHASRPTSRFQYRSEPYSFRHDQSLRVSGWSSYSWVSPIAPCA
jgi:hypothetical protein